MSSGHYRAATETTMWWVNAGHSSKWRTSPQPVTIRIFNTLQTVGSLGTCGVTLWLHSDWGSLCSCRWSEGLGSQTALHKHQEVSQSSPYQSMKVEVVATKAAARPPARLWEVRAGNKMGKWLSVIHCHRTEQLICWQCGHVDRHVMRRLTGTQETSKSPCVTLSIA
jgi:hypothetical protein